MIIKTVGGLIGTIGLMRQYQKGTTPGCKKMAARWEEVIDLFVSDWQRGGINGSAELFNERTTPQGGDKERI
jgi:hypothetical protein